MRMYRAHAGARAFTLLEVLMALSIFVLLSLFVFHMAANQTRARAHATTMLDTEQNARVALDSMQSDLRVAGLGIGYSVAGTFSGVQMGIFGAGNDFNQDDYTHANGSVSDDLRIRGALGPARTIASWEGIQESGDFQACAGGGFEDGERILVVDSTYTNSRALQVTSVATGVTCQWGQCTGGCDTVTFTDDSAFFQSDGNARHANYQGGTVFRGYFDHLYFVHWVGGVPGLYSTSDPASCMNAANARDACATPANLLGEGVESLQYRVLEVDPTSSAVPPIVDQTHNTTWQDPAFGIQSRNKLMIEIEVIARSPTNEPDRPVGRICSLVQPGDTAACFPTGGPGVVDRHVRRRLGTTVEIKNTSFMSFNAMRE